MCRSVLRGVDHMAWSIAARSPAACSMYKIGRRIAVLWGCWSENQSPPPIQASLVLRWTEYPPM